MALPLAQGFPTLEVYIQSVFDNYKEPKMDSAFRGIPK